MPSRHLPALLLLLALPAAVLAHQGEDRLLRYPDIHADQVAFVHAGDIWLVPVEGGVARQITSHQGQELFPKFSPDGQWIAFSAEYAGNRQVFVMPAEGGPPRQLTWYNDIGPLPPRGGVDYRVLGWTPDGHQVLVRANRVGWDERAGRYYLVPVEGGLETPLAIPEGGGGDLSADGRWMAYTPIDREFRTWKRYRGGRAQDLWLYDLRESRAERITTFEGTDNQPVWLDGIVYFTSDRKRTLNLYAYDPRTRETRAVTDHDDYDVLWPSAGPGGVVYENGGFLYRFDPDSGRSTRIPVHLSGDLPLTLPHLRPVKDFIQSVDLSPSGARAVFEARGDLYSVPAEHGEIRNLTRSQGVREMDPAWSPDGKWIAYLSDRTGEYEIYVRAQDGTGEERRVTTDGDIWRFPPAWSPDSKRLAFGDKRQRLRYAEVETGRVVEVDHDRFGDITFYTWSPDSRWLAYQKGSGARTQVIWVYSVEEDRRIPLTDDRTTNFAPTFDPGGKYLYFLSNRDFNLTFSDWEFNYLYTNPTRIYVGALAPDVALPLAPRSDEEKPAEETEEEGEAPGDGRRSKKEGAGKAEEETPEKEAPPRVRVVAEGFDDRVVALPGPAAAYRALTGTNDGLLYLVGEGGNAALKSFDLEKEKEETWIESISGYVLSRDGKKVLYRTGGDYGIVEAGAGKKNSEGRLALEQMEMRIDPPAEWAQMFMDGWRILRDWFYDPNLHGVDWKAMRERYGVLVPHVAHRADLDYILGELGGELNAGHVYVQSGDQPGVERREGGLLGAELQADASGRYRITKIFSGENWHPEFRSPLTEPGVDVREGEFLLAIDGQPVTTRDNPYRFLENKANRLVVLRVSAEPRDEGARDVRVRPVAHETNLRYLDWVKERRRRVDEASGGRIGYIHLPNTSTDGNRELFKHFYPQAGKDALIIDVRYNGGGFIPDRMIELLDRPRLNWWVTRAEEPQPTPGFAHHGPKACLINHTSSSGGDAFPYYFRKRGLGPLIGTRTWGGLIGLSGNPSLADGGAILVPTFRFLDTEGIWAVEGEGVAPDIEVWDAPDLVAAGRDPSLEKAIEVLMEELRKNPPAPLEVPPPPVDRP